MQIFKVLDWLQIYYCKCLGMAIWVWAQYYRKGVPEGHSFLKLSFSTVISKNVMNYELLSISIDSEEKYFT